MYDILNVNLDVKGLHHVAVLCTKYWKKQSTFFGVYYDILNVNLDVKGLHHVAVLYTKY
jgi:hypothetical protein